MADETEFVEFEVDVADKASPKLSRLEKNIGKVGGAVDRASSNFVGMIKQSAMFAGFFALGPAIAGAKNYINHLDKISDLTGIAADRVGGISNALQGSGVSAEGVESVFSSLVKKGAKIAEGNKMLITLGKKYGVTIKEGPEEALLGVSKLLEKGKINAGGMQRILGLSADDAADMSDALGQGPEELKKKFDELTKKNASFNEEAMNGMQEYHNASSRIGVAWNRLTAGIIIKLAPTLTKLAEKFEGSIDGWMAGAERFGNFLVTHMDKIIAMAKTYARIMLVNTAVQKVTGKGVVGLAGTAYSAIRGRMMQPGIVGPGAAIMSFITPLLKGFSSFRPIIQGLTRLAPIGGVIMLVVAGVKALGENFNHITDRLKSTFGGIISTVSRIGAKIASLFSEDSALGQFFGAIGYAFLEVVNKIGEAVQFVLNIVEKIIGMIPDVFKSIDLADMPGRAGEANELEKKMRKRGAGAYGISPDQLEANIKSMRDRIMAGTFYGADQTNVAKTPTSIKKMTNKEDPGVYQDFRGSRFDIKQAFAEGYDPDRIATAFSSELGSVGERKLTSGFAPMFTVP